ncbi:hypothetical protein GF366_04125 [Candidatus Peregrinibacteria bacterium]|nr:hypothetical protein [Candidatus Peregrinibacteria bacterium]
MNTKDKISLVNRVARGNEYELIEKYIKEGPTFLKEKLGLSNEEWTLVFDYLVFEHNLLYKCITRNADFFIQEYVKDGTTYIREILDIIPPKYDMPFEVVFDFLAISNDGLYYHVIENRDKYLNALRARGGDFVRKVLGIWRRKYDETWERVLNFLLKTVCKTIFSEQTLDRGIEAFSKIINGVRVHRPINKYGLIL